MVNNWNYQGMRNRLEKKGSFLSLNQMIDLINATTNPKDRLFMILLCFSGRRIGELMTLKVNDFDYEDNTIGWYIEKRVKMKEVKEYLDNLKITNPEKHAKLIEEGVKIPLALKPYIKIPLINLGITNLPDLIQEYIDNNKLGYEDYIFSSSHRNKGCLTTRWAEYKVLKLAKKIGLKGIHPHKFRHGYAKLLAKNGYTESVIKEQLQHSSILISAIYTQLDMTLQKEILKNKPINVDLKKVE